MSNECKGKPYAQSHVIYVRSGPKHERCSVLVKALVITLAFMIAACLVLLSLYLTERGKPPKKRAVETDLKAASQQKHPQHDKFNGGSCWTADCIRAASDLLDTVDPSVDPCEDFYQYACGGWLKKNPLPKGDTTWSWGVFDKVKDENDQMMTLAFRDREVRAMYSKEEAVLKALNFYESCMDEESVELLNGEPLKRLLKTLDMWGISDDNFQEGKNWDLVTKVVKIHKDLYEFPLFAMGVEVDIKNSSQYVVMLKEPRLDMVRKQELLGNDTRSIKIRKAYRGMMRNLTRQLELVEFSETVLEEVFSFEKEFAKITSHPRMLFALQRAAKKMTLRELQQKTGDYLNWTDYVRQMLKETSLQVNDDKEIYVANIAFFKKLAKLLSVTPKRVIDNFLMWTVIKAEFLKLSSEFSEIFKNFYLQAHERWRDTNQRKLCFDLTSYYFDMPYSKIFLDRKFYGQSKKLAMEMIEEVRSSFIASLQREDWLDEETKKAAIEKAGAVIQNVGYADYLMDVDYLTREYKEVNIHPKTYFDNVISAKRRIFMKKLAKVGRQVDKSAWSMAPTVINARYDPQANKMVFPAAFLQPPIFNMLYPRAVNYGSVGSVMAHELTHGFDNSGSEYDSQGNKRNWWSNSTWKIFNERSQCLVKQYSNFTIFGKKINGEQTLSENIADNGGVKFALEAYRKWVSEHWEEPRLPGMMLTNEQAFFISLAKYWCRHYSEKGASIAMVVPHSPSPWRLRGTLMNLPDFSKAFKCPVGSPMNPEKKCKVW